VESGDDKAEQRHCHQPTRQCNVGPNQGQRGVQERGVTAANANAVNVPYHVANDILGVQMGAGLGAATAIGTLIGMGDVPSVGSW
jgi:hypothetical protein